MYNTTTWESVQSFNVSESDADNSGLQWAPLSPDCLYLAMRTRPLVLRYTLGGAASDASYAVTTSKSVSKCYRVLSATRLRYSKSGCKSFSRLHFYTLFNNFGVGKQRVSKTIESKGRELLPFLLLLLKFSIFIIRLITYATKPQCITARDSLQYQYSSKASKYTFMHYTVNVVYSI